MRTAEHYAKEIADIKRPVEEIPVKQWAEERFEITLRISRLKSGDDRREWLEDAYYWQRILSELRKLRN